MGSYYKHTRSESVDLTYSFRCEQCNREIGPLKVTFTGSAYRNSNFKDLSDAADEKLRQAAHKDLVKKLKGAHTDAVEKQIISVAFQDECPSCHKPQSWGVGGMKKKMFETPVTILILDVIASLFCLLARYLADGGYVKSNVDVLTYPVIGGIAAAGVLIALLSLLWNVVKIGMKTKKTSSGMMRNLPVIQWEAAREFLSEP